MKKKYLIVFILIFFLFTYEMYITPGVGLQLAAGFIFIIFRKNIFKDKSHYGWAFGLLFILLGIFSTRVAWLITALAVVVFLSQNRDFLEIVLRSLNIKRWQKHDEYIAVNFENAKTAAMKVQKQKLFGDFEKGAFDIYEWEDFNLSKFSGNMVIDLGNTIIPTGDHVIFLRQGFGKTKLIVPKGLSLSLNVTFLLGNATIAGKTLSFRSENMKWQTEQFSTDNRRVKVVINGWVGELEVFFI